MATQQKQVPPSNTSIPIAIKPGERILRWPEVQLRVGICRSHAHQLALKSAFPKPIKLGPRASGWLCSAIDAWLAERVAASTNSSGPGVA